MTGGFAYNEFYADAITFDGKIWSKETQSLQASPILHPHKLWIGSAKLFLDGRRQNPNLNTMIVA